MKNIIPKEDRLVNSLSWSKVSTWQKSKKQFIKQYFEKEPFFETKEVIFGSTLWNMIEIWEFENEDKITEKVLRNFDGVVEVNEKKERRIRESIENIKSNPEFIAKLQDMAFDFGSEMETKMISFIDWVCILWYADNTTADWKKLKEFKTGKTPWTQEKVDNHGQLDFYCLMTYLEKGYFPEDVELTWFETKDDSEGGITVTGKIKTFKYDVEKNKERILARKEKLPKIFKDIMQAQLDWQWSEEKQEIDENLFKKLWEVEKEKSRLDDISKEIKSQIEEDMKKKNITDWKIEWVWSVGYTIRKSYEYNDEVKQAESFYKKMKKDFEQNNEYTEKASLTFRFNK